MTRCSPPPSTASAEVPAAAAAAAAGPALEAPVGLPVDGGSPAAEIAEGVVAPVPGIAAAIARPAAILRGQLARAVSAAEVRATAIVSEIGPAAVVSEIGAARAAPVVSKPLIAPVISEPLIAAVIPEPLVALATAAEVLRVDRGIGPVAQILLARAGIAIGDPAAMAGIVAPVRPVGRQRRRPAVADVVAVDVVPVVDVHIDVAAAPVGVAAAPEPTDHGGPGGKGHAGEEGLA